MTAETSQLEFLYRMLEKSNKTVQRQIVLENFSFSQNEKRNIVHKNILYHLRVSCFIEIQFRFRELKLNYKLVARKHIV